MMLELEGGEGQKWGPVGPVQLLLKILTKENQCKLKTS
jgi:hypothetical protein